MQIVPMRDLKNTTKIEKLCSESNGPVFVTKNGYGRLVVMDIDYYDHTMRKIDESSLILRGLNDVEHDQVIEGKTAIKALREKHGI